MAQALLAVIVFLSFGIEAAMGFGCNVLALTMAVHLYPMDTLLPVLVGLNLLVSTYIVLRHRSEIDWPVLRRRILPFMVAGMPAGMLLLYLGSGGALKLGFGGFVVALSAFELLRLVLNRRSTAINRPLSTWQTVLVLLGGGLMHGLYASGGPMAVYFSSRALPDKGAFRATLSLLWLLLNLILMAGYVIRGMVTWETTRLSALMLLPLGLGIVAGEWLHNKVDAMTFRLLIFGLLLAGGVVLVVGS
jgi:uncharacterized membrane protein YfcA